MSRGVETLGAVLRDDALLDAVVLGEVLSVSTIKGIDRDNRVRARGTAGGKMCGSCGQPVGDQGWYHNRLRSYVHGTQECMANLCGEDVRNHAMTMVTQGES